LDKLIVEFDNGVGESAECAKRRLTNGMKFDNKSS
jgi:hypothetical protein